MIVESTSIAIAATHTKWYKFTHLKRRFEICILIFVPLKFPYIIYKEVEALMM